MKTISADELVPGQSWKEGRRTVRMIERLPARDPLSIIRLRVVDVATGEQINLDLYRKNRREILVSGEDA
jgi:hypothetical protein